MLIIFTVATNHLFLFFYVVVSKNCDGIANGLGLELAFVIDFVCGHIVCFLQEGIR